MYNDTPPYFKQTQYENKEEGGLINFDGIIIISFMIEFFKNILLIFVIIFGEQI